MSRPDRWWRPSTARRPAQRARLRRMYTAEEVAEEVADGFELGYRCGQSDDRKRQGDMLDVADAAGVTPASVPDETEAAERLPDEVERWLREQG